MVTPNNSNRRLILAAIAAFCTYFCMYAFRKPFTAATFDNHVGLKSTLVLSQLAGYMISKFLGIKLVSELKRQHRAIAIIGLIGIAELALVGFAYAPLRWKPAMLFVNGLPLGMIFGIVLAYLEGRKQTEALSAALCASFIISSGWVKSVGRWLIQEQGVSEFTMPMLVGLAFLPPLSVSVWLLQRTPPPDSSDIELRQSRRTMSGADRRRFWNAYWPGLSMLVYVYVALTIVRTIRDDFAVEIWRDMGIEETPAIFAQSETVVAIGVTALNAMAICVRQNVRAIRLTIWLMCLSFGVAGVSAYLQSRGSVAPFGFMVACGVGMYVPYVAFHTTVFERLVAASKHPGNLVFLMYVADAVGYLGYAIVTVRSELGGSGNVLPIFQTMLYFVAATSVAALIFALWYFQNKLRSESVASDEVQPSND